MTILKSAPAGLLIVALLGTGALVATSDMLQAQEQTPDAKVMRVDSRDGDHGKRGHRGHRGGEMMRSLFDAVDANGDRSVTAEEIAAYQATQIANADLSGDGALSIEEFDTIFREFTRSRMVDAFQALDSDGDGLITETEIDTRVSRMVERMDRDGDGVLTLQRGRGGN